MSYKDIVTEAVEAKTGEKLSWDGWKTYDPYRETPEFCERLLKMFGKNIYGENIYRVIWGENHYNDQIIGGMWGDTETVEYRIIPDITKKYILQKWLPPEQLGSPALFYDTNQFNNSIDHGLWSDPVYPTRGRFEHIYTFQNDVIGSPEYGQYEYPSIMKMILIAKCIEAGKLYSKVEKMNANQQARDKKEQDWKNKMQDMVSDSMLPMEGSPYYLKCQAEYERKMAKGLTAEQIAPKMGNTPFQQIGAK